MGVTNEAKIKLSAEDATAQAFNSVVKNVTNLKSELIGLPAKFTQIAIATAGIGSIAGFTSMISSVIESRAQLRDLSIQTNISVEALASLGKIGKLTGTPIEDIATASNKLSKALLTQNEDSKGAAAGIQALGLDYQKFKNLSPDQQMLTVAKALDKFEDSSEKSGIAALFFGKAGAQMLPFLRELSQRGLEATRATTQQAEEAKRYEENLRALQIAGDEWKKELAGDMLPALLSFTSALIDGKAAYGNWYGFITDLATRSPFKSVAEDLRGVQSELTQLDNQWKKHQALPGISLLEKLGFADDKVDYQQAKDELNSRKVYLQLRQQRDALSFGAEINAGYVDARTAVRRPKLVLPDTTKDGDALAHKQFQGQLKLIHDQGQQQKDAVEYANRFLKAAYDEGLVSLADYFDQDKQLRQAGVQAELDSIDKEIAAAEQLKKHAEKPETVQQADNTIADAKARRASIVAKAAQTEVLANQENAKSVQQLAYSYYDLLASVKELQGDSEGAFNLRLAQQIQDKAKLLRQIGFSPDEAKAQAEAIGQLLIAQNNVNTAQSTYQRLMDTLGVKEKNLTLDAQASGESEFETLRKIGAARRDQLPDLQAQVDKITAAADATKNPDLILAAQKLASTFKQAVAEADPIFQKIHDIGREVSDGVANDAENAIVQWQGFRNLLNAIEQDVLRILTHDLFTKPLSDGLTGLIGGNGQASGGGGILNKIFGSIFGAAGGAAASSGGGFGTGQQFGNLDFGGFFADGGTLQPGEWGIVGENGPEKIYAGATPATVYPNSGGSQQSVVINQTFAPGTDRRTIAQAAAQAGDTVSRAMRRNR